MQEKSERFDRETRVSFRALTRDDLPMMLAWMVQPDVAAWYEAEDPTLEGMEREFGAMIDGTDPVRGFIVLVDLTPIGYIQGYRLGDHPDYLSQLDLDADDVSMDIFLGDPAYRGHGWGAPVLSAFLRQIVFGEMAAQRAAIMPVPGNARAIKAYQRVGFQPIRAVTVRDTDTGKIEDELIMLLPREAFFADS